MTDKSRLHSLVDNLPEAFLQEAEQLLERLASERHSDVPTTLSEAPLDDERETASERKAVKEAYGAVARGDVVRDVELERELGW